MRKASNPKIGGSRTTPTVVGSGLVVLDLVVGSVVAGRFAGGTCGNVLSVLAWLGWRALPVATIGRDPWGAELLEDFRRSRVDTSLVAVSDDVTTPAILERIRTSHSGVGSHSFSPRCPTCGAWFARPRLADRAFAEHVSETIPEASVFFFDRVSRGTVALARHYREAGALVMFEPTRAGEGNLFEQALALSHVVKYSDQRIGGNGLQAAVPLEVQTLGSDGLRYRLSSGGARWRNLPAVPAAAVIDSAGAGDWCSAGLLRRLGDAGDRGVTAADEECIRAALRYGQALAAVNCEYEGARGAMYAMTRARIDAAAERLAAGAVVRSAPPRRQERRKVSLQELCRCTTTR